MRQEISINFNPAIDFDFKGFNEISEINFDPSFFDRSLNFGNFSLNNFEVSDFFIKQVKVRNLLSTVFKKNIFLFNLFFALYNLDFRKVLFEELGKSFFGAVFPKIRIFFKVSFN